MLFTNSKTIQGARKGDIVNYYNVLCTVGSSLALNLGYIVNIIFAYITFGYITLVSFKVVCILYKCVQFVLYIIIVCISFVYITDT